MATNDKYDRQLRLWGANGQKALMESSILLVNACAVGSETLKNLVLPGVGRFTVLDSELVQPTDVASNFFVTASSVGRPRAEVVTELLQEMNPDVLGSARIASVSSLLLTEPNFFQSFSLVMAANVEETHLVLLATICAAYTVPLLVLRSCGLMGYVRVQVQGHEIVESRPDSESTDLRILECVCSRTIGSGASSGNSEAASNYFPGLTDLCDQIDVDGCSTTLDSLEHSHIPYVVILYHALKRWREQNVGRVPQSFAEKEEFKAIVKGLARDHRNQINFVEALRESHRAYSSGALQNEAKALVDAQRGKTLGVHSTLFAYCLRALQMFIDRHNGMPPLTGALPDMTATSAGFADLQRVYRLQAHADREEFTRLLYEVMVDCGYVRPTASSSPEAIAVSMQPFTDEVTLFCRNTRNLRLQTTRTVSEERALLSLSVTTAAVIAGSTSQTAFTTVSVLETIADDSNDEDQMQTPIGYYLALRAADAWQARQPHQRIPGSIDSLLENDIEEVWREMQALVQRSVNYRSSSGSNECFGDLEGEGNDSNSNGSSHSNPLSEGSEKAISKCVGREHAREVCRAGGRELHTVSAVLGGVGAQEAVKLLTHQYVCLDNTFVYNGVAGSGAVYLL